MTGVQIRGDPLTRPAFGIPSEDPPNHLGLIVVDLQPKALRFTARIQSDRHRAIAVGHPARVKPALNLAIEPPTNLVREITAVELIDEPTYAAHYPPSFTGRRIVRIGDADDPDSSMLEPPENCFAVNRVAREPIQRFDDQHVELPCERRSMHRAGARSVDDCYRARHGGIAVFSDDLEPERFSPRAANAKLIGDRR